MTASRARLPRSIELLLRDELSVAIEQANLGTLDTLVAKKYLIEQVPQIEIAEEIGYDRSVVTRRVKALLPRVEYAAQRLFGNSIPPGA